MVSEVRYDPKRGPMNQVKRPSTFKPLTNVPVDTWLKTTHMKRPNEEKWQTFDVPRGSSLAYRKEFQTTTTNKMAHVSSNYKGKNPMSRSQWRIFQRRRKAEREATKEPQPESRTNVPQRMDKGKQRKPLERKPISRRLEWPDRGESDDEGNSEFNVTLDIMVNIVSALPR